jgi:hypothetical protein
MNSPAGEVSAEVPLEEEGGSLLKQGKVVETGKVATVDTLDQRERG